MNDGTMSGAPPDRPVETMVARLALILALPLGLAPIQPGLDLMMSALRRRHPGAFERLAELGETTLLVDPVDLPAVFLLRVGSRPSLRACRRDDPRIAESRTRIRGALAVLLDLFEGRIDGDALFFSRALTIEGDTELVVGLRNAVDGEDFDLIVDLGSLFGPLARLPLRRPLERTAKALRDLHDEILAPVSRRLDRFERRLDRLEGGRR
ncbi:MAG: SCP2 sterol-binding domain-containing protein [Rhodospirillaceae bacterium]